MTDQPLEPKAWDGRWLAIAFVKPTSSVPAHYMLYEAQRAANYWEAAMLMVSKFNLAADTHLMVIALTPEIETTVRSGTAVEPEVPSPRWYRVQEQNRAVIAVSEDQWLRQIRAEWAYKPPPPPPAPVTPESPAAITTRLGG